jgi:hypothetical protein
LLVAAVVVLMAVEVSATEVMIPVEVALVVAEIVAMTVVNSRRLKYKRFTSIARKD